MNRREFIHDLSHLAALGGVLPTLGFGMFDSSYELLSETVTPGNILILIRLDGGNDGLNTVIPLDQFSALNNVRPDVIMPENKLIDLGKNDLALHPSLADFKVFSDEKRMKVIQNVGYEQPDFSHFRSMDIWQSASDYDEFVTSGWVGRYLEDRHPNFPNNYPNETYPHPLAIELGHQTSLMLT
ncbi:MAG: twin-arginine translocation pathway signal, partial [Flavobacteriaceae bacterium]|nr:twin-arginine translocation pathway signal [Flavobacteriaceae bacterium]